MGIIIQETQIKIQQSRGAKAHQIHQEIIEWKSLLTKDFLELGKRLYVIQQEKLYEALDYTSFAQYLATPEISLSMSTAYTLIDIFKTYLVDYEIEEQRLLPIGRTKLERILPVVSKENFDHWLHKAENLSTSDLTSEVREEQGEKTFEYKYQKETVIKFKGDTLMEKYLEHRRNLHEYVCEDDDHWILTPKEGEIKCPFCDKKMYLNGTINYKPPKELI